MAMPQDPLHPLPQLRKVKVQNTLASILLPYCLKAAGLKNVAVRPGSSTSIKYILQLPSGDTSMFSGLPTTIYYKHIPLRRGGLGRMF